MKNSLSKIWRNNSLSIIVLGLFVIFLFGQSVTGHRQFNEEQLSHSQSVVNYGEYLHSSHFVEAVFENWESEFLQMSMYVLLTVYFVQKGSAESRVPGADMPHSRIKANSPALARTKGITRKLYENSLFLALFALFLMSFFLHAAGGAGTACEEAKLHGGECYSTVGYMTTSQFWFESFQNWQSEFLAVGSLVILSIYLRQQGSPESKLVTDPNSKTG